MADYHSFRVDYSFFKLNPSVNANKNLDYVCLNKFIVDDEANFRTSVWLTHTGCPKKMLLKEKLIT